jgi:hypothetical protein
MIQRTITKSIAPKASQAWPVEGEKHAKTNNAIDNAPTNKLI